MVLKSFSGITEINKIVSLTNLSQKITVYCMPTNFFKVTKESKYRSVLVDSDLNVMHGKRYQGWNPAYHYPKTRGRLY